MWLLTNVGFFSIVQKPGDKQCGTLTIRARMHGDLTALKNEYLPCLGPITESLNTDYRFRATAPREQVSAAMARLVGDIDYGNFKFEVAKVQGQERASLYREVWDVLHKLQTDPAFADKDVVADSFGGIVISGGGRVLLREPTKHHGGYAWTFAKTGAKPGETPREAAIRAVREKTGYEADILVSVPGLFKGASTTTNFYVMDAKHPPAKPNWQTHGIRWVKFDEARDLIRQSPNLGGRDRDLDILDVAEKAVGLIPYQEHANVQPEDWPDLRAMNERNTVLYPKLFPKFWFSPDEIRRIQRGFFPTVMEQKWFVYFSGTRLRLHRSWTGILIYDVGFAFDREGGAHVTDVIVTRDLSEWGNADDGQDLNQLEEVIRYLLLEPLEEPEIDGMVKAMMLATQPNYLGSPEVVSGLVQEIFDVVVRQYADEATDDDVAAAGATVISAFTEEASGYTRMAGWNSVEQMGAAITKYLAPAAAYCDDDSLSEILEIGLIMLVSKLKEILAGFEEDPAANWEPDALVQLNSVHHFVVAVLLGTNAVTYGEKKLEDFAWQSVTDKAGAG